MRYSHPQTPTYEQLHSLRYLNFQGLPDSVLTTSPEDFTDIARMRISILLLQTVLLFTYAATSPDGDDSKCCFDDLSVGDMAEKDRKGRVVSVMKILTYDKLNSKSPVPDEIKRKVKKICGEYDIVGTLIDRKLGGLADESANALPMDIATHVMWRQHVTEPTYHYLRRHPERSVIFIANLHYDAVNNSRPYFLSVQVKHAYCLECRKFAGATNNPAHEQYVVKGFISNPFGTEDVICHLYKTEERLVTHSIISSQQFKWIHLSLRWYNETMQKKYDSVLSEGRKRGILLKKVEWTEKTIVLADLNFDESTVKKDRGLERILVLGNENDVPAMLISPRLNGLDWANFVPVRPSTLVELDDIVNPIIDYFNDTEHKNNQMTLQVDVVYDDDLAVRPAGFLYTATVTEKQINGSERITLSWPEFFMSKFIKN